MKTIHLLIALLLFSSRAISQIPSGVISLEDAAFNPYYFNKENIPKVHGKVLNLTEKEIAELKVNYTLVTPLESYQQKKTCSLNSDGTFDLELDYAFPYQQIWLSVGDLFYSGIYANKDLSIEIDASVIKTNGKMTYLIGPGIRFSGTDGFLNESTNSHTLFKRNDQQAIIQKIQALVINQPANYNLFIKTYDSLFTLLNDLDLEYFQQHPSSFSWIISNQRKSEYLGNLCMLHLNQPMNPELFERVKNHKGYTVSNEDMLFYNYYFYYLDAMTKRKRTLQNAPDDLVAETLQTLKLLDSLHTPSKSDFLKIKFSSMDPEEHKVILQTALTEIKTDWCTEVVQQEFEKTQEKLAAIHNILGESKSLRDKNLGEPILEMPFGAKLYQVNSGNAKNLLSMLRSSFTNKALFVDFWATWCGPCISEFPYSKKLKEATKDQPIEFVYLCTSNSSNLEKWKSKIAEYKLSGIHIFVEESIENELMDLFSFSGFPSYLFIDTQGENKPGYYRPSMMDPEMLIKLIEN